MNTDATVDYSRILAKLHGDFLSVLQTSQSKLLDPDRAEVHALCLSALSSAGRGAPAVLLLASKDGTLSLELSSGPLPCPPEDLVFHVSEADRALLARDPFVLGSLEGFQKVLHALKTGEVFAAALSLDGRLAGALVLLGSGKEDSLRLLSAQINHVLEYAGLFETLVGQAMLDDLTGLFNHRYLTARLPQEIARASRHGHSISVVFCDIDDFGAFTQNNGRISGYSLLARVAEFLKPRAQQTEPVFSFRSSDIPVRYGLEQFVVMLPETPKEGAVTKAERLCRVVESTQFPGGDTQPLGKITLSIGVATFPEDASDAVSILEAADMALNQARERGKNRVQAV